MASYESITQPLDLHEPLTCVLIQDLLPLYSENEVSADSREVIAAHLSACERCAGWLAGAHSTRAQFQRVQEQRTTAAARERLEPARGDEPPLFSLAVQISAALGLAALVSFTVLNFLRATSLIQLYVTPWAFGLSISSLWLLVGVALLGLATLLLRPNRFSPEWKTAISLAALAWGLIGASWKFISYMEAVSAGINGIRVSPYAFFGVLLPLAGGFSLWHARDRLARVQLPALLKRLGGLLGLGVAIFVSALLLLTGFLNVQECGSLFNCSLPITSDATPLYATPRSFNLSNSARWLLAGIWLPGLVAVLLRQPSRFAPAWKAAISLATIAWGVLYLDSLSVGMNGMPVSPFVLFGVLLLLAGGVGLWRARDELLSVRLWALLKRLGGLLVLGVAAFAVLNVLFGPVP